MENAEVPVTELSLEEKERSISAAKETLNASLSLLQSELVHNLVQKSDILAIYYCETSVPVSKLFSTLTF